jgi:hypothetical protein
MSYAAAVEQLNAMVPELYQSSGQPRRKFSLDEIRILLAALGDPHRRFPVRADCRNQRQRLNGRHAGLHPDRISGLRTGLYTSPHLARVNERIRLDRAEIDDDAFAALYFRVHDAAQQLVLDGQLPQLPSFFEILTAQALLYFAEAASTSPCSKWAWAGGWMRPTLSIRCSPSSPTFRSTTPSGWARPSPPLPRKGRHSAPQWDADHAAAAP